MLNVAGFAREGAGEENVYGVKSEYEPGWDYYDQNEEMAEAISTSRDSDHKDVKPSLSSGLDRMVIPNQWSYGHQEILRKGDKNTFYCEVSFYNILLTHDIKFLSYNITSKGLLRRVKQSRDNEESH